MIEAILTHIKTNILTNNPKTFVKGYTGARQYQDGQVVIYDNFEGEYVGLTDTKNNYFYIRYLENIALDAVENRSISCQELTGTAPVRLVAWVYRANLGKLSEVLLNDIMNTDFTTLATTDKQRFSDIRLYFTQMLYDPEVIFKEETLKEENEEVKLAKNAVLIAIDFGVQFNYKTKNTEIADCLDRDICEGCD